MQNTIVRDWLGQEINVGDTCAIAFHQSSSSCLRLVNVLAFVEDAYGRQQVKIKFDKTGKQSERSARQLIVLTPEQLIMKELCS